MTGRSWNHVGFREHVPSALLPSDPALYWQLTEEEEMLIAQLTEAYKMTQSDQPYIKLSRGAQAMSGDETLSIVGQMTADMLAFFKAVPDFALLFLKDQASLLRANAVALLLQRNSFAAVHDTEEMEMDLVQHISSPCPQSNGLDSRQLLKPQPAAAAAEEEHLVHRLCQFQRSLRPIVRHDMATHVLLQCAVLFETRAPDLWDRQTINRLQDKYMILMKHYVESQCSYLFCWHYVDDMLELVEQSKTLAAQVSILFPSWTAVMGHVLDTLSSPQPAR